MNVDNPIVERQAWDIDGGNPVGARALPPPQDPLAKLDPVLHFIRAATPEEKRQELDLHVLVKVKPQGIETLRTVEFRATSYFEGIAAGYVRASRLDELAALDAVIAADGPRPMRLQIDQSVPGIFGGAAARRFGTGQGAIVGIIDDGISYCHQAFRHANGHSRIVALWEQGLTDVKKGETQPDIVPNNVGFVDPSRYGVLYERQAITDQIADPARPHQIVRRPPNTQDWHGTAVAAIAAGNDSTFCGVASEADIMMVSGRRWLNDPPVSRRQPDEWLMATPNVLDAANFLRTQAEKVEQPIAINISLGDSFGPHDGTSLLEQGLAKIGSQRGCIVVVSAGNSYNEEQHASGSVAKHPVCLELFVSANEKHVDYVDIWYAGSTDLKIAIVPPSAPMPRSSGSYVGPDDLRRLKYTEVDENTLAAVYSVRETGINNDRRICVSLIGRTEAGRQSAVTSGPWKLCLVAPGAKRPVEFHAWTGGLSRFGCPSGVASVDPRMTVLTPGCAEDLITVGAHGTAKAGRVGKLYLDSAEGPTRDVPPKGQRRRRKPDLCAPGDFVDSAQAVDCATGAMSPYGGQREGTSFAAPHVTGTVALMLACNKNLTTSQVRATLDTACTSARGGSKDRWGAGMLDAAKALRLLCKQSLPDGPHPTGETHARKEEDD